MATPPYAKILVSVNGGAPVSGGIDVPSSATIALSAESTIGWVQQRWELYDYPEGFPVPAGWTEAPDGTYYSTAVTPPPFTLPAAAIRWGAYALRLRVNEQVVDDTKKIGELLDESTILSMLSPKGQRDIAARETVQFTTAKTRLKQWTRSYQRNLRAIEALLGGVGVTPVGTGFRHVTNDVEDINSKLVENADVAANAGIAGSKVNPNFGAQDVTTTGIGSFDAVRVGGGVPATAGYMRVPTGKQILAAVRNAANTQDLRAILLSADGSVNVGTDDTFLTATQAPNSRVFGSSSVSLGIASNTYVYCSAGLGTIVSYSGHNISLGWHTPSYGGGAGVVFLRSASTNPTTNPTSGLILYSDDDDGSRARIRYPDGHIATLSGVDPTVNGFRPTLVSGAPIAPNDVVDASTIFWTPYRSGAIALWTGSTWALRLGGELALALSGLTLGKIYSVFQYWNGTALALERSAAWTNDTTPADAITRRDGIQVKASDHTRRLVFNFRATGPTTTDFSVSKRFVCAVDNLIPVHCYVQDTTASWTHTSATYRQVRGQAANKVEVVLSANTPIVAEARILQSGLPAGTGVAMLPGIGIDNLTNVAQSYAQLLASTLPSDQWNPAHCSYDGVLTAGHHAINWLESGHAGGCTAFGQFAGCQSHMRVRLMM